MQKFNEWRAGVTQHENPEILIDKLHKLVYQLESELGAFEGERFDGFLNLIGGVKQLQRSLAEINNGCTADVEKFTTQR